MYTGYAAYPQTFSSTHNPRAFEHIDKTFYPHAGRVKHFASYRQFMLFTKYKPVHMNI